MIQIVGEMSAKDLELCINPKTRDVTKITVSDAMLADSVIRKLMDEGASHRKAFYESKGEIL